MTDYIRLELRSRTFTFSDHGDWTTERSAKMSSRSLASICRECDAQPSVDPGSHQGTQYAVVAREGDKSIVVEGYDYIDALAGRERWTDVALNIERTLARA